LVTVEAMFPELKGGAIYRTGRGRASTVKAAISRAFGDVLKQNRGKRYHSVKATITIIEESPKETNETQVQRCSAEPLS
jgi:anthranilate/para-aminobenzoate synthase component II